MLRSVTVTSHGRLDIGDGDVVHFDNQEFLLALACLAHRNSCVFEMTAGGARFHENRRRLVVAMSEVEVVESGFALTSAAAAGSVGHALRHAPRPREHL